MPRKTKSEAKKAIDAGQLDLLATQDFCNRQLKQELAKVMKPIKLPKQSDNFQLWIEQCVSPILQYATDAVQHCEPETRARLGVELVRILTQYKPPAKTVEVRMSTHLTAQGQSAQFHQILFDQDDGDE